MKFNGKKCLAVTGIVLGVIIILLAVLLLTLPFIVKGGIQHVGPVITGVPMEIQSFSLNPFQGTVTIKGFILGNPKGYSSPYAIKLEHLHLDLGMSTLFDKKLLIERIEVKGVELNYETSVLNNNIQEIQNNVNKLAGGNDKGGKADKSTEGAASKPLQIDYLELRDITAWVIVKGSKAQAPLPVAPIVMTKLGTGENGVTSVMVINDVLVSMITGVTRLIGADAAFKAVGGLFTSDKSKADDKAAGKAAADKKK